ncbi:hypothetical protein [Solilutibacter silvestris]|uniref:hypothetical protein n=1 Tax=Solilutibacter silvestris TaxID=1645665 RepID=UPI003D32B5AD
MKRHSLPITVMLCVLVVSPAQSHAQDIGGWLKRAAKQVQDDITNKVENKAKETVARPAEKALDGKAPATGSSSSSDRGYSAPSRDVRLGNVPQNLLLKPAVGKKFDPAQGRPQIIAINPYLQPDRIFFSGMGGLQCPVEGGLIIAGDAGFSEKGDTIGEGYWRIAGDGAISPLLTRRYKDSGVRSNSPMLPANPPDKSWADGNLPSPGYTYYHVDGFGLARNGDILLGANDVVVRIARDGRVRRVAGKAGQQGLADGNGSAALFKHPGRPVEDDQGNLWLADQDGCAIRKIATDGMVSTLMGADRLCNAAQISAQEQIVPDNMIWDMHRGELVVGGHFIRSKPHDLYHAVWRIRPDGQARRVLFAQKNGGAGLKLDGIYSTALDAQGRLYLGVGRPGRNNAIARVDEPGGKVTFLTGTAYTGFAPGNEGYPVDGAASGSNFRTSEDMCFAADGDLYVIDYHLLRRYDPAAGTVRTWAY